MSDKGRIDDLASLFLPDLLHPLSVDATAGKNDDPFLWQERRSNISTPLSSGLGMFMAFADHRDDQQQQGTTTITQSGSGAAQYPQAQPHAGSFGGYASHFYLAFPESDFSHTLHYADFIPAEAGLQPPLHHHRRAMFPVQPAFSPSTVIGQFDSMAWPDDSGFQGADFLTPRPPPPPAQAPRPRPKLLQIAKLSDTREPSPAHSKDVKRDKKDHKRRPDTIAVPQVQVDYSSAALARLLALAPRGAAAPLTDVSGCPVAVSFAASLDGRLFTNDHDNYNYACASDGVPQRGTTIAPRVISCYRRNFVLVAVKAGLGAFLGRLFVQGEPVLRMRIDVGAEAEGMDRTKAQSPEFMVVTDKERGKERTRPSAGGEISIVDKSTPVEVVELVGEAHFAIRKLQFRSATSNSSNIQHQTYYRLMVQLVAETPGGAHVVRELASACMTVRGRNPSFYEDRNDVRINQGDGARATEDIDRAVKRESSELVQEEDTDSAPYEALGTDVGAAMSMGLLQPTTDSGEGEGTSTDPESGLILARDAVAELGNEQNDLSENAPNIEHTKQVEQTEHESAHDHNPNHSESESGTPQDADAGALAQPMANVGEFIAAKTQNTDSNYHYFPILSVYYLPPINVVYFPHGAHQDSMTESSVTREDSKALSPASTGAEKKRVSKVYFR